MLSTPNADIRKLPRHFLPTDFHLQQWEDLQPYFDNLLHRELTDRAGLEQWLRDLSELQAVISEDACWRQIRMTCDTENKELEEAFNHFCLAIEPKIKPYNDALNRKLIACTYTDELDMEEYAMYLRQVKKDIDLYCEENVTLQAELNVLAQQYGVITGKMTITISGNEYTLQQAARFLQQSDRDLREQVYRQMAERRMQDQEVLDDLFDQLVNKRQQVALQAGFTDYRSYRFQELGRFDYTWEDCFAFHDAIEKYILPVVDQIYLHKQQSLGLDRLFPWDLDAEPPGIEPLRPFENGDELLEKAIHVFERLHPFFAGCLLKMKSLHQLDLDSRKGKAPGGYNCPLAETGAPFIFMNAAGTADDVVTLMHEAGHAFHSFLSHPLALSAFKEYPMEMAELASMSMELISMDHWEVFYPDTALLKRARLEELERVITIFPWIATIDAFQHWLYTHPGHSHRERNEAWLAIHQRFTSKHIQWGGLEDLRNILWQKQLHLFEVPFYYIEYGIAQLGAIALWRNYRQQPELTLQQYMTALAKGATSDLRNLYQHAGITFDFSAEKIKELGQFIQQEIQSLIQ